MTAPIVVSVIMILYYVVYFGFLLWLLEGLWKYVLVYADYISGRELETLSPVKGGTIQSKHIRKAIVQSFKILAGGELKAYNEMMNEARALATKRMVEEAEAL